MYILQLKNSFGNSFFSSAVKTWISCFTTIFFVGISVKQASFVVYFLDHIPTFCLDEIAVDLLGVQWWFQPQVNIEIILENSLTKCCSYPQSSFGSSMPLRSKVDMSQIVII